MQGGRSLRRLRLGDCLICGIGLSCTAGAPVRLGSFRRRPAIGIKDLPAIWLGVAEAENIPVLPVFVRRVGDAIRPGPLEALPTVFSGQALPKLRVVGGLRTLVGAQKHSKEGHLVDQHVSKNVVQAQEPVRRRVSVHIVVRAFVRIYKDARIFEEIAVLRLIEY